MPAGSIADKKSVSSRGDLGADLHKVLIHGLGGRIGHDHGGADSAIGADGAEEVGGDMTVVADHAGARADRGPDVGVTALLTYARFILKPDFQRPAGRGFRERGFDQVGEVFLKASSASGSFCG